MIALQSYQIRVYDARPGYERASTLVATDLAAARTIDDAEAQADLAVSLLSQGKREEMEKVCLELAGGARADVLNSLAWEFATSLAPNQRDGPWAVRLAEVAVTATGRTKAMYLDTLAAAYAENGDFPKAIQAQQDAINHLEPTDEREDYESRLKVYENHSPYRH